jgi:UrcA family protein
MFAKPILAASIALSALGFAACAGSVYAADVSTDAGSVSIKVGYSDLNLSSQAGAEALMRRIHHAASDICGGPSRDLGIEQQYNSCMDATVGAAVAKVNSPILTALNSGHAIRSATVFAASGR